MTGLVSLGSLGFRSGSSFVVSEGLFGSQAIFEVHMGPGDTGKMGAAAG